MRINLERLSEQGFETNFDQEENTLSIWPRNPSEKLQRAINRVAKEAGLNDSNCDALHAQLHNLQIIQAIAS